MIRIYEKPSVADWAKTLRCHLFQALVGGGVTPNGYRYYPKWQTFAKSAAQAENNYLYRIGERG